MVICFLGIKNGCHFQTKIHVGIVVDRVLRLIDKLSIDMDTPEISLDECPISKTNIEQGNVSTVTEKGCSTLIRISAAQEDGLSFIVGQKVHKNCQYKETILGHGMLINVWISDSNEPATPKLRSN